MSCVASNGMPKLNIDVDGLRWVMSCKFSASWIGLDGRNGRMVGWVGLGYENWTHVHV